MRSKAIKISAVTLIVIIAMTIQIFSLNRQLKRVKESLDKELIIKYNNLQKDIEIIQKERDSLKIERSIWVTEKENLIEFNYTLDSLWNKKAKSYGYKKNVIVRDGTITNVAKFLSEY